MVGIKFWKWLWWAMMFNPHRYCLFRQIVHFWWPCFVETALTANHCGCQILQEQRFPSKHALDAKYQSGFYICKLFSLFTVFVSLKFDVFTSKQNSILYVLHSLQDLWTAFMLKMLIFLFTSWHMKEDLLLFKIFLWGRLKNVKLQMLDAYGLFTGIGFAWCILALSKI